MSARQCLDCSASISSMSKGGRCRACAIRHLNATDPTIKERRAKGLRRKIETDPAYVAKLRASQAKACRSQLDHIPAYYRDEYRRLVRSKHYRAPQAQRIIMEQIEADTRGLDPLAAAIHLKMGQTA